MKARIFWLSGQSFRDYSCGSAKYIFRLVPRICQNCNRITLGREIISQWTLSNRVVRTTRKIIAVYGTSQRKESSINPSVLNPWQTSAGHYRSVKSYRCGADFWSNRSSWKQCPWGDRVMQLSFFIRRPLPAQFAIFSYFQISLPFSLF